MNKAIHPNARTMQPMTIIGVGTGIVSLLNRKKETMVAAASIPACVDSGGVLAGCCIIHAPRFAFTVGAHAT